MSAIKCPAPGCGGTEAYVARAVYSWRREFRWWCFWRGVRLVRQRVGDCAVCPRCECAFVITDDDIFLTQTALAKLGAPRYQPVGMHPPERNGMREPGYRPVEIEP